MDLGELAMALVDAATVVIGSPTVLVGPHPLAVYAAYLTNALRPKTKFVSIIGGILETTHTFSNHLTQPANPRLGPVHHRN